MHRFTLLVTALATLSFAAPAPAQAPAEAKKAPTLTLAKLVAVRNLRCDALSRGKRARLRADIHRAELTGAFGPSKISVETQIAQSEAESGAAFEEAGNLRRRLEGMTERYVSDHRL
ncbi:MAG: hypothetical protein KDA24_22895, partial [Deltaproteobacteria bacterium]|nr:hypothetical protein [Deltaproteobacteria bacterium]